MRKALVLYMYVTLVMTSTALRCHMIVKTYGEKKCNMEFKSHNYGISMVIGGKDRVNLQQHRLTEGNWLRCSSGNIKGVSTNKFYSQQVAGWS